MEFTDVVHARRMVRNYDPQRPVSRDIIEALLGLAIRAPSAGFSQGWQFVALDTAETRSEFWRLTREAGPADSWLTNMQTAPVLVLALSDKAAYLDRYAEPDKGWTDRDERHWPVPYWDIDTGMASLLIMLGAVDQGLASCFFGVPPQHQAAVKTRFSIPARLSIIGVLSLGYGLADRRSPSLKRGRRGVDEVLSYGQLADPSQLSAGPG